MSAPEPGPSERMKCTGFRGQTCAAAASEARPAQRRRRQSERWSSMFISSCRYTRREHGDELQYAKSECSASARWARRWRSTCSPRATTSPATIRLTRRVVPPRRSASRCASRAREVARASDLVIIVVGFDHEVETVMFGAGGVMESARPGLIVAVGSTVAPRYARRLAERAAERGVVRARYPARARRGGGQGRQAAHLRRAARKPPSTPAGRRSAPLPPTSSISAPAGAGQVGKMVNNLILWACTSAQRRRPAPGRSARRRARKAARGAAPLERAELGDGPAQPTSPACRGRRRT